MKYVVILVSKGFWIKQSSLQLKNKLLLLFIKATRIIEKSQKKIQKVGIFSIQPAA